MSFLLSFSVFIAEWSKCCVAFMRCGTWIWKCVWKNNTKHGAVSHFPPFNKSKLWFFIQFVWKTFICKFFIWNIHSVPSAKRFVYKSPVLILLFCSLLNNTNQVDTFQVINLWCFIFVCKRISHPCHVGVNLAHHEWYALIASAKHLCIEFMMCGADEW